jgi:predicted nucleic acid-binding protein
MTEVAYAATEKDARKLDDAVERAIDELFGDRDVIRVVEYHELIAREARRKIRQAITNGWSLKPMDAIHLATATRVSADELQTYDEPLLKYKGAMGFTIRQPVSLSPRLDLGDRGSLQQQP